MTPAQLIKLYGSKREAAYRLGYTEPAIHKWVKQDRIPSKAQRLIEAATNGLLKARK